MSLKFKSFLQRIAGRRTSQSTGYRRAFHVALIQIGGLDDPRRSLAELIRRELTIFDQATHTLMASLLARRYCQMFSTGFNSGA